MGMGVLDGWILHRTLTYISKTVTAIFYLEMLSKNPDARPEDLNKIEACWKLANSPS